MLRALLLAVCGLAPTVVARGEDSPGRSRQCLVVLAEGWDSTHGSLWMLERGDAWKIEAGPLAVHLGRAGLRERKREGDGCSPSGIFPLGAAFGFRPEMAGETRLPFRLITATTEAVDDPRSRFYNQIVEREKIAEPDWHSSEAMRKIAPYRRGVVVRYNLPATRGAGSCIFLHCVDPRRPATSGCTALAEADLIRVLRWLDPAANPVLVQMPRAVYEGKRQAWRLPQL